MQIAAGIVAVLMLITGLCVLLIMPLMVAAFLAAIHLAPNVVFQNFCKDVWMDNKGFLLQLKEQQIQVPFEQVQKITWHGSNNPPRAKITLASSGPYGLVYTFIPDLTAGRQHARQMIESLNERLAK